MPPNLAVVERDLTTILEHVEAITSLTSNWNGHVRLTDEVGLSGQPLFSGKKDWDCGISLHRTLLKDPSLFCTLVHEAIHAVSSGLTPRGLDGFRGYEEGVVEKLTRMIGPRIARMMKVRVSFESRRRFDDFITSLEVIRGVSGRREDEFYVDLLGIPLAEREATVVKWSVTANPEDRPSRVLARIAVAMRGLR